MGSVVAGLRDPNSEIRLRTAEALNMAGWRLRNEKHRALYLLAKQDWKALEELGEPAVEALIRALTDKDSEIRRNVAFLLRRIKDPRAIGPLQETRNDPDNRVREAARQALGQLKDVKDVISTDTMEKIWAVQEKVVEALGKFSNATIELLLQELKDCDNVIRKAIIFVLGEKKAKQAVELLIQMLQDPDWEIRRESAIALGKIGDSKALDALILALKDVDWHVGVKAVEALAMIGDVRAIDPLYEIMINQPPLPGTGITKPADIFQALSSIPDSAHVAGSASLALGIFGEFALSHLIQAMQHENEQVRLAAVEALGKTETPLAVEPLIEALQDPSMVVKQRAMNSLRILNNPQAVMPLTQFVQNEIESIRNSSVWALANLGDPRAVPYVIPALQDESADIRRYAIMALGASGDPQVIERILPFLQDDDYSTRRYAVEALGNVNDSRVIESLRPMLNDPHWWVRKEAVGALEKLNWQPADEMEQVLFLIKNQNWDELKRFGSLAVDPLCHILRDRDPDLQEEFTRALGELGETRAIDTLLTTMKNNRDWDVRRAAAIALDKLGWKPLTKPDQVLHLMAKDDFKTAIKLDPEMSYGIVDALRSKSSKVRKNAAKAIGQLGNAMAEADLKQALRDDNWFVLAAVKEAITELHEKNY